MLSLKRQFLTLLASLLLPLSVQAQTEDSSAMLDKLLKFPGSYGQICDVLVMPSPAPIPGFRQAVVGEASFSEKNMELMRKNRAGILKAVAAKFAALNPLKKGVEQPLDPTVPKDEDGNYETDGTPRGFDPGAYSYLLLFIVQELDGVEVFPALLDFEEKFHKAQAAAEKDPKAPIPAGAEGSVAMMGLYQDDKGEPLDIDALPAAKKAELEHKSAVFASSLTQRDMLAVMVRIMRKAGYDPMLKSPLEAEYGKLLKEKWQNDEELKKYKSTEDIPAEERDNIKFDPIHEVAYLPWDPVHIPFNEEKRQAIRKLAADFAKTKK